MRNIKEMRLDKGETQEETASAIGISQRLYSFYETGKVRFPCVLLSKLADHWETTTDHLLGRYLDAKRY